MRILKQAFICWRPQGLRTGFMLTFQRTLYCFQGQEWSYERDRRLKEKFQPHFGEMLALRKAEDLNGDSQIANLSENQHLHLQAIQMELQLFRDRGRKVPDDKDIKAYQWIEMLDMSNNARHNRYIHLWRQAEMLKRKKQKFDNSDTRQPTSTDSKILEQTDDGPIAFAGKLYKENRNRRCQRMKYLQAKQFGCPLIIDFGFDSCMDYNAVRSLCTQVSCLQYNNWLNVNPFHLVFANAKLSERFALMFIYMTKADKQFSHVFADWFEDCYTSLYPREQLVYLTADSPYELTTFNPSDIYIIGGLVERAGSKPITYEKAKGQRVRTARIPHSIRIGDTRNYNLDVVLNLLLVLQNYRSWQSALEAEPQKFTKRFPVTSN